MSVHAAGASQIDPVALGVPESLAHPDAIAWRDAPTAALRPSASVRGTAKQRAATWPLAGVLIGRWAESPPTIAHALSASLAPPLARAAALGGRPFTVVSLDRTFEACLPTGASPVQRAARRSAGGRLARAVRDADRWVALHAGARDSWSALGIPPDRVRLTDSGMGIALGEYFDGPEPAARRATAREHLRVVADDAPLVIAVHGGTDMERAALEANFAGAKWFDVPSTSTRAPSPAVEAADIVVSLERIVEQAVVLQQAAVLGIPSVSWRVPGNSEVVRHGQSGVLCAPFELDGMVKALTALRLPATRATAGDRARSLAARLFDRDFAVRKILSLYDELLTGEGAEPAHLNASGQLVPGRELVGG